MLATKSPFPISIHFEVGQRIAQLYFIVLLWYVKRHENIFFLFLQIDCNDISNNLIVESEAGKMAKQ